MLFGWPICHVLRNGEESEAFILGNHLGICFFKCTPLLPSPPYRVEDTHPPLRRTGVNLAEIHLHLRPTSCLRVFRDHVGKALHSHDTFWARKWVLSRGEPKKKLRCSNLTVSPMSLSARCAFYLCGAIDSGSISRGIITIAWLPRFH